MTIFHALVLGLVEGLTEFLPISSTAHLIITSKLLGLQQTEFQKFFEVFIQGGAILAVLFLYIQYLQKHKNVIKNLLFSFVPTGVIGFVLYKIIKTIFFESNQLIVFSLFSVGIAFLVLEYLVSKKTIQTEKRLSSVTPLEAFSIGLAQALAVVPGVSRSGIVMLFMMSRGYKRDESAQYSFLLAVPTLLAASGYDLFKMRAVVFSSMGNLPLVLVGTLVSFITAYFVMKWLIGFLKKNSLTSFGIYRILLAIILMFLLR